MSRNTGRTICPRCGANNFDTVSICWKCHTPLPVATTSAAGTPAPYPGAPTAPSRVPPASPGAGSSDGDPASARRAAIALALTLPWLGLPIGWIIMMTGNYRQQAIGRLCATWSLIALIFHLMLTFVAAQSLGSLLVQTLSILKSTRQEPYGSPRGLP